MSVQEYDYVVIGSGLGGLFTAALLTVEGKSVCVLEKHYVAGGYAHSFCRNKYWFCAGLHYVFNCLKTEDGGLFFKKLGLDREVLFEPMPSEGFDQLDFPTLKYSIPRGFERNIESLSCLFPSHRNGLRKYFDLIGKIYQECFQVSMHCPWTSLCRPWKFSSIIRYRRYTTQEFFDMLRFPLELQAVLSGQCGNLGIPPKESSLLAHALNVVAYDQGAAFPEKGYRHMIQAVESVIKRSGRSQILLNQDVTELERVGKGITAAITRDGKRIPAKHFIFNADPKRLFEMVDLPLSQSHLRYRMNYDYSPSSFTLYLGLKNIDLSSHGFGNWNIWRYPSFDLNAVYHRQITQGDLSDPFLAITTPTLHGNAKKFIAPPQGHQMVIVTWTGYHKFQELRSCGKEIYKKAKQSVIDTILDRIERDYVPNLRAHIDALEGGTPTTNEHYVSAPFGNSYGANLTPTHLNFKKPGFRSPFGNLYFINATTGMPGLGGGIRGALFLTSILVKDKHLRQRLLKKRQILEDLSTPRPQVPWHRPKSASLPGSRPLPQ